MPFGVKRAGQQRTDLTRSAWDDDFHGLSLLNEPNRIGCPLVTPLVPIRILTSRVSYSLSLDDRR